MTRMRNSMVVLAVSAAAAAVTASAVEAQPAGQVCRKFTQGGLAFTSETLGTGWTCTAAKSWIVKLGNDRIRVSARNVPLSNGPRGYHCFATPSSWRGRATSGACIKGTIAFPGSGFAWNGTSS